MATATLFVILYIIYGALIKSIDGAAKKPDDFPWCKAHIIPHSNPLKIGPNVDFEEAFYCDRMHLQTAHFVCWFDDDQNQPCPVAPDVNPAANLIPTQEDQAVKRKRFRSYEVSRWWTGKANAPDTLQKTCNYKRACPTKKTGSAHMELNNGMNKVIIRLTKIIKLY